jgi:hypothetical protein
LAGFGVGLNGVGTVTTGSIQALGPVGVASQTSSVSVGNVNTGEFFLTLAATGVSTGSITTAPDATTYIADASMLALIDPVTLDPTPVFNATPVRLGGPVSIGGAVSTGRFVSASTGSFAAQGAITATESVSISSGALASFNGIVAAPTITVRSGDIGIGTSGGLGTSSTQQLTVEVEPGTGAINIGGASGQGYSLSADEAARLRAQRISVAAIGNITRPAATINLGSMTLQGSGAAQPNLAGGQGSFALSTPGSIRVTGSVALQNAAAGNLLSLAAGQQILLDTSLGGALSVTGASPGALAGQVQLSAIDVWSGNTSLLSQLATDPNFAGRDALLGQGTSSVAGLPLDSQSTVVIAANALSFNVSRSLLIANTGTSRLRDGFRAGSGGISVRGLSQGQGGLSIGSGPQIEVIINGQALSDTGVLLTNQRTLDAFTFTPGQAGRSLTDVSSLNGCLFSGAACGVSEGDPVQIAAVHASTEPEEIEERVEEERRRANRAVTESDKKPSVLISRLIDGAILTNDDVIDEPVSGAGNPSLWSQPMQGGEPQ